MAKNSSRARTATAPPSAATRPVEPHQTAAITNGISTAAVTTRAAVPELAPAAFAGLALVQIRLLGKFIRTGSPTRAFARAEVQAAGPELRSPPRPDRHSAVRVSGSLPARRK